MQTIEYEGEATIAVDGVLRELLDEEQWSPGDWLIVVHIVNENAIDDDDTTVVTGWLIDFERFPQQRCWVTISPVDPEDTEKSLGSQQRIETGTITKLVIP